MLELIVILAAKNEERLICVDEFREWGIEPIIVTEDGSVGIKGTVIDALNLLYPEDGTE